MKHLLFLAMCICLALQACTSSTGEYEKKIKEYIEKDNVFKMDLDVKVSDIKATDVTVADSIAILKKEYEANRAESISTLTERIAAAEKNIEERKSRPASVVTQTLIETYQKDIESCKAELTKIETSAPAYLEMYKGQSESKVIAKLVTCSLSLKNPLNNTQEEKTTQFIFSADGSKCLKLVK